MAVDDRAATIMSAHDAETVIPGNRAGSIAVANGTFIFSAQAPEIVCPGPANNTTVYCTEILDICRKRRQGCRE